MRTILSIEIGASAVAAALLLLAPAGARAGDDPEAEVLAEALHLHDCLPPGGRELAFSVGLQRGEPDAVTGARTLDAASRIQLALPIGERLGLTADVGLDAAGGLLDTPGASLKLLLREPRPGRTGLSVALDLYGSTHSLAEAEAGIGAGFVRDAGPVAIRGAVAGATGLSSWSPHLHAGLSAAWAPGDRWRLLAEVVAEAGGGEALLSAGPAVKWIAGDSASLTAGLLLPAGGSGREPLLTVQVTQGI